MTTGQCPVCGQSFESRHPKTYCSLRCYVASPALRARLAANNQARSRQARQADRTCPQCAQTFHVKQSSSQRFCRPSHYRQFYADRFDRYIANPERLHGLPQAYDGFLAADELACLVDGCAWRGQSLSSHMNFSHGIRQRAFKQLAGFNLTTGVIAQPLRERLEARPHIHQAVLAGGGGGRTQPGGYVSLERREKVAKHLALYPVTHGCLVCAATFVGHPTRKFCSPACYQQSLVSKAALARRPPSPKVCPMCLGTFVGHPNRVFCTDACRKRSLADRARDRWRATRTTPVESHAEGA